MESPLEFHSVKPDNVGANLCGFGCADYGPGRCFSTDRGFVLHKSIIRYPSTYKQALFALTALAVYVYNQGMAKRLPKDVRAYFSKLGKKGGKKGGAMRAANMTKEQLSESARNAVKARWAKVKQEATSSR
jgi:hypothetical protein